VLLRNSEPFVALQTEYSIIQRTPERELLPMAQGFGLTITLWSVLGAGQNSAMRPLQISIFVSTISRLLDALERLVNISKN
jgi:aryl-alcohol dehydrogenase-like predicted oxidoreductase